MPILEIRKKIQMKESDKCYGQNKKCDPAEKSLEIPFHNMSLPVTSLLSQYITLSQIYAILTQRKPKEREREQDQKKLSCQNQTQK